MSFGLRRVQLTVGQVAIAVETMAMRRQEIEAKRDALWAEGEPEGSLSLDRLDQKIRLLSELERTLTRAEEEGA